MNELFTPGEARSSYNEEQIELLKKMSYKNLGKMSESKKTTAQDLAENITIAKQEKDIDEEDYILGLA
ncbi:MAG: hypothetical protein WC606_05095 [Candidatus Absconditabacterales bacterium]